jgi:hypothetical protein
MGNFSRDIDVAANAKPFSFYRFFILSDCRVFQEIAIDK